ncbi:S8/S53 family peptidase [Actinoplanes sp. TBRC 11911]|uniref:S53 family peptidase n=1 Tax=Actinoplanes sp. TBRC 11911 TaxID=2729386 RepID=UPI00145F9862|nr:S53 family peptidase [Actinoplanes sp. TBRC 11911]NMO55511.1 S8/S53 family peptidase [Actinoplanes sp. TBRC 11911]
MRGITRHGPASIAVIAAVTVLALLALGGAAPVSSPGRLAIAGSLPTWLSQAQQLGGTPGGSRIDFGLVVGMRDHDDAVATLRRISDPDSPEYGRWLSNKQFRDRYAPAPPDIAAVRDWILSQGFRVDKILPSGMYIEASGTAARVNKVFGTTVDNFSYRGALVHANAGELSFPSHTPKSVVRLIGGVLGIDQGAQLHELADPEPAPAPALTSGTPCSDYYGQRTATDQPAFDGRKQPYSICGYTPDQLQSAYGESSLLNAGIDGRGVTVAVVLAYASRTMPGDAQQYNRVHHQPLFRPGQYRQITPAADGYGRIQECDAQGAYVEQALDVEAVHAMAPGAGIVYVAGTDCDTGLTNAWAETIDNHVADIVTDSWSLGGDDAATAGADMVKFFDQFALEAALTGMTVVFATGDVSDGGTQPPATTVSFPTDDPYVTSVGATSLAIGRDGRRKFEYGWQSAYVRGARNGAWGPPDLHAGGGGGTSAIYPQPFYQKGVVPASTMRTVPDISVDGDSNTGFLLGATQSFPDGPRWSQFRLGGTSLSAPLLAGMIAVADQNAGHRLGFVNPLYYKMLKTPALYDVVAPSTPVAQVRADFVNGRDATGGRKFQLETIDTPTTLHDRTGYDTSTGVGAPNGPRFFDPPAGPAAR